MVSSSVMPSAKIHVAMPGNHALRMVAAAVASIGITSTQNHQYSQPIVKPAQWPIARSA